MFQKIKIKKRLTKFLNNFENYSRLDLHNISNYLYKNEPDIFESIFNNFQRIQIKEFKIKEIQKIDHVYFCKTDIKYKLDENKHAITTNIRCNNELINLNFINNLTYN